MAKLKEAIEAGLAPTDPMDRALDVFDWLLGDRPRAKGVFHPSEICDEESWCMRKFYFGIAEVQPEKSYLHASDTYHLTKEP